jgi:hypothetical protein
MHSLYNKIEVAVVQTDLWCLEANVLWLLESSCVFQWVSVPSPCWGVYTKHIFMLILEELEQALGSRFLSPQLATHCRALPWSDDLRQANQWEITETQFSTRQAGSPVILVYGLWAYSVQWHFMKGKNARLQSHYKLLEIQEASPRSPIHQLFSSSALDCCTVNSFSCRHFCHVLAHIGKACPAPALVKDLRGTF